MKARDFKISIMHYQSVMLAYWDWRTNYCSSNVVIIEIDVSQKNLPGRAI